MFNLQFEETYTLVHVSKERIELRNNTFKKYEGKMICEHKEYFPDEEEYLKFKEFFDSGQKNFKVTTIIKIED